ncbi:Protein kinase C and casein kinase substrate in neurons protein 2, partial [Characodon lateralis]|nr:Protein kinase C and casein kinase substrate in neurons protein 2 [Characodon lateralis]
DWSVDLNRTLSRREKKKPSEGVTLTAISQTGSDQPVQPAKSSSSANSTEKTPDWSDEDTSGNPFSANGDSNPFEEEPESPVISVPVKALYDYEGQEQDELSFKAGDEFTKIGEEDDQGWCKGRLKDGKMGLYPANYVEDLQ